MRITSIDIVPNDQWLHARIGVEEPKQTLNLMIRRNSGVIWLNRKAEGEATLAFIVTPGNKRYWQDDLAILAQDLSKHEFLGIGDHGQLLFDHGVDAQPTAHLEPKDLLDNSTDDIRYSSDLSVPGIDQPSK